MVRVVYCAALGAAMFAGPAAAQSRDHRDDQAVQMLRQVQNPANADAIAGVIEALARSLMAMPVAPIAQAVEQIDPDTALADLPADATLGDVSGMDSIDPDRLGDDAHAAATMAAGMASQMETMLPMLRAMAHDMAVQWDRARDDARNNARREGRSR